MSTFSGISSALSALSSHRKAMDVIGQNIANVNTPGYTRQRADLQEVVSRSGISLQGPSLPVGNGVDVVAISRAYDELASAQVNTRTADHALLSGRSATLSGLEAITNEPGDNGLASALNKMWSAWSAASTAVGSTGEAAARVVVIGATQTVVDTLRNGNAAIEQAWTTRAAQAQAGVLEVNTAASDVAELNELIQKAKSSGGNANELMDQRDQLVTRIVELTGATTQAGPNGQVDLFIGSGTLVQGKTVQKLALTTPGTLTDYRAGGKVAFTLGAAPLTIGNGQLAADTEALTRTLPDAAQSYDSIAAQIAKDVNFMQQRDGAKDGDGTVSTPATTTPPAPAVRTSAIFVGDSPITAATIRVAVTNGSQLALGLESRGANDGSNAKDIAALGSSLTRLSLKDSYPDAVQKGPDALWSSYVADLGAKGASAAQRATAAQQMLTSAVTDQQGSAGVSLDEETAGLIAAQRAYQGAARVLTAVDEMLDTLINKTGLVGR